jgi:hypothetical protein
MQFVTIPAITIWVPDGWKARQDFNGRPLFRKPKAGEYFIPDNSPVCCTPLQQTVTEGACGDYSRLIVERVAEVWLWPKELGNNVVSIFKDGSKWYAISTKAYQFCLDNGIDNPFPWFTPPTTLTEVKNPNV